jgi:predicted permease
MLAQLRSWLKAMSNRARVEQEMAEELRFHLDSYVSDLCHQGVQREEALRRARLEFGGVEAHKEECRESLGLRLWDELCADLRSGLRVLRQSPVFTGVAVISLALGIGANTAIFSIANQILLKTLSVPHAERLRLFTWARRPDSHLGPVWGSFDRNEFGEGIGATFPYPLYQSMARQQKVMESIAGFKDLQRLTALIDGQAEPVDALMVSGNFYQVVGARIEAGRSITPADDSASANGVVVISDGFWASRFARSASVLGKTITLNSVPLTIVGINAPDFKGPRPGEDPQVYFPISLQNAVAPNPDGPLLTNHGYWWVFLLGRLKPGVSPEAAQRALDVGFRDAFHATLPEKKDRDRPRFVLQAGERGFNWGPNHLRKPIYLLLAAAGLVLLVACANLANLLLARATVRQREMSLRLAVGAGRARLIRQVLVECLLLAFMGGAAGLFLGFLSRNFIPGLMLNDWSGEAVNVQLDWRVFAFAFVVTLTTGLVFGMVPAWRCTSTDPGAALKEMGRMSTSRPKALFGKALVVFQVALSLVLLVGAGLFVRTLFNLRHAPTGLNPEHVLLFELNPARARYSPPKRIRLFQKVAETLATVPGVQSSTASSEPLLANSMVNDCFHTGKDAPEHNSIFINYVGGDFFKTFDIPVLSGRAITTMDKQTAPKVAVVNRVFAQSFFGHSNPIGKTVRGCDAKASPLEIVGVSANAKYDAIRGAIPETIYIPYAQADDVDSMTFEVRSAASVASFTPKLRAVVQTIDKDLPVLEIRTQNEQIDAILSTERIFATLTAGFGVLALLLASIGIYGVMAYTVSRRTNEIGIRMALGAHARGVLTMVLRESLVLAGVGIIAGILGAAAATRIVASMLFGLTPTDKLTFAGAAVLLLGVSILAALLPAWRAARVDPLHALRHE